MDSLAMRRKRPNRASLPKKPVVTESGGVVPTETECRIGGEARHRPDYCLRIFVVVKEEERFARSPQRNKIQRPACELRVLPP